MARKTSAFRFKRIAPQTDDHFVWHRESGVYLGIISPNGSQTYPWVAIVDNPSYVREALPEEILHAPERVDLHAVDQRQTLRLFGTSRNDIAAGLYRHWLDYPQCRLPDPRDGRRDDVPPPPEPEV